MNKGQYFLGNNLLYKYWGESLTCQVQLTCHRFIYMCVLCWHTCEWDQKMSVRANTKNVSISTERELIGEDL